MSDVAQSHTDNKLTLSGLPNEVLLHIIDVVDVDDVEAFTICCKFLNCLGGDRRRLCKLKKAQFSVVAVGDTRRSVWDNKVRNPIFHPLVALKYFLRDGQNTLFPRTLYLGGTGDHGLRDLDYDVLDDDNDYNERVENLEIVNARKEHFDSKVHQVLQSLLGDTLEANQWSMLISSQDPDAAAALLITILPNLQTLNIYVPWTGHLTQQLKKIHLSSAAASCNRSPPLHSFSSLSELYIQGDSQEDLTVFDMLATSMLIPSLRRLKGRSIKASDQSWPHKEGCSGVTEISLDSCAIDSNSLSECLRAVRSLQLFDYTFDIGQIYPPTYLEPRGIVAALRKYASTTLVHLGLNMEAPRAYQNFDNGEPFLDSLRSFEKLETIRLDSVMLFKEVEVSIASSVSDDGEALVEIQRLVDFLPASTRRLELIGGLSTEDAAEMFANMDELKHERLPDLCEIFLKDNDPLDQETKEICRKTGIKLRAWKMRLSPWHGVYATTKPA